MSNTGRFRDSTPVLSAAGKVLTIPEEDASTCVSPSYQPPPTPHEIQKYRHSYRGQVGTTITHWGKVEDAIPDIRHGVVDVCDATASESVNPPLKTEIQQLQTERAEAIYQSNQREPLGRGYSRRHRLPEKTQDPSFRFGEPGSTSNVSAKESIYPVGREAVDDPESHSKYVKSHNDYEPGEQVRRGYNWESARIDPKSFRFGTTDKDAIADGAAKTVNPEKDPNSEAFKTKIVPKSVQDFHKSTHHELGRPKNLGFGPRNMSPDFAFGVPSQREPEWGAKDCIVGGYSIEEQMPDPDVGKSIRPGLRNVTSEVRAFGLPTVRTDIRPPKAKSVADHQNYGTEAAGPSVIHPSKYSTIGVFEEDFALVRDKEELRAIVKGAGIVDSDDLFEQAYEIVAQQTGGRVSLEAFRIVWAELSVIAKGY